MEKMKNNQLGFTLLEMLVVITILGILAAVGMGQYWTSQKKAKDGQRKSDLANLARALEMYYNDFGEYPADNDNGKIKVDDFALGWGQPFDTDEAIYMKVLPRDPKAASDGSEWDYCYMSDGDSFQLYARLENENDSDYQDSFDDTDCELISYNYVVTSSNIAQPTIAQPTITPDE